MDLSTLNWGSPVGLGLFLAGLGLFFWCLFSGIAALHRAKDAAESPR
jgi:hypothetical protein